MARAGERFPVGAPVASMTRWGLSPDADLVYRTLVTFGQGTCQSLAYDLGIPVSRAERAIDELAAAGAVSGPGSGRTAPRWRALPPATVVAMLDQRRRLRPLPDLAGRLRYHQAVLAGDALPDGPHPVGLRAWRHVGVAQARQRIAHLAGAERREHLALNPEPQFTAAAAAAALPVDRELYARGISVRVCGVPTAQIGPDWDEVHRLAARCGQYREHPRIPIKIMVFDRRVALLPIDPLDPSVGALEVDQPAVVAALVALFEQTWSTASDPWKRDMTPIGLTPREHAIIALLAEGHTDASVAQHLRISQRTIAYTLRALMDRIGVDNRFQLGLALGEAHAIDRAVPRVSQRPSQEENP